MPLFDEGFLPSPRDSCLLLRIEESLSGGSRSTTPSLGSYGWDLDGPGTRRCGPPLDPDGVGSRTVSLRELSWSALPWPLSAGGVLPLVGEFRAT